MPEQLTILPPRTGALLLIIGELERERALLTMRGQRWVELAVRIDRARAELFGGRP